MGIRSETADIRFRCPCVETAATSHADCMPGCVVHGVIENVPKLGNIYGMGLGIGFVVRVLGTCESEISVRIESRTESGGSRLHVQCRLSCGNCVCALATAVQLHVKWSCKTYILTANGAKVNVFVEQ